MKKYLVGLVILSLVFGFAFTSFAQDYSEAPMLAELVKQGKLPPVEERLPAKPFVVGPGVLISEEDLPDWEVGKYGGTLRTAHSVADWAPDVFVMGNEPLLCAPGIGVKGIKGNIVEDFEVEDNRIFTFKFREGLKWSDGEPVTTEDIRFTYEDVLLNEKITPVFPAKFRVGNSLEGEPMNLEIIDEYTFRVTFPEPYGGFLRILTIETWNGYTDLLKPAHYLKQFHAKYTPLEELKPLLEKEQLKDEWWQLFNLKDFTNWEQTQAASIGFPVLTPWCLVKASGGVYEWERNPYYFKVDTAGNQLPYIDKITSTQVQDVEMVNMKVLTGEVDFLRESTSLVNIPLYKQNEERGGFRTVLLDMHVDSSAFFPNLTYEDPVWREIVGDVRFRRAISAAINRREIIDSVYYGFASLPEETVPAEYIERDLTLANGLLDEVGLSEKGADGVRLRPDGEPLTILIECGAEAPDLIPVGELLVEHLKPVGIKATLKRIDPQLRGQRTAANELQATIMWCHDQGYNNTWTSEIFGTSAQAWWRWYTTNGKEGEEPPDWAKKAWEIDKKRWQSVTGSDEYEELWREGLAWHREYLPLITIVEKVKYPVIVSAKMGNIPSSGFAIAANFSAEQFFFGE